MGKDPKLIAARSDGVNDCEANDLGSRKEEDRGGTASTLGKVESGEEGGVRHGARMKPAASVAGFSLWRGVTEAWMPDELGNTCDRARPHRHTVCVLPQTHSATLHTRSENRPPSSRTNRGDVSEVAAPCLVFDRG